MLQDAPLYDCHGAVPTRTLHAAADDGMRNTETGGSGAEALQSISRALHQDMTRNGIRVLTVLDSPAGTIMMVCSRADMQSSEVGCKWPCMSRTGPSCVCATCGQDGISAESLEAAPRDTFDVVSGTEVCLECVIQHCGT